MTLPTVCGLSNACPFAGALHKGQVCGGGGSLMNALSGYVFTAVRIKENMTGWD